MTILLGLLTAPPIGPVRVDPHEVLQLLMLTFMGMAICIKVIMEGAVAERGEEIGSGPGR